MPIVSILAILPSLSQRAPAVSWGVPCDQLTGEEKTPPDLQMVLRDLQASPESGQLQHSALFWDIHKGQW